MADTPRKFEWLAAEDKESTHLELQTGGVYDSSVISHHMLRQWEQEGKLRFLEDDVTVVLPADVVLQVQNATIGLTALVKAVKDGIKEERNG
jgi:hypothetical protein